MAGVDSRCRFQNPCALGTSMRVMKETVTLPTVWQEAFVFPNTQAKQSNSVDEQEEEPAVDLMLVVLNCCRNRVN
jgi:hypothetical protein